MRERWEPGAVFEPDHDDGATPDHRAVFAIASSPSAEIAVLIRLDGSTSVQVGYNLLFCAGDRGVA